MNKKPRLIFFFLLFITSIFGQEGDSYSYEYALIEASKQKYIGNLNEALKLYKSCLNYKDDSDVAYFEIANIYAAMQEYDLAEDNFENAYTLDPDNYWYVISYAQVLELNKENKKAFKVLKGADNIFNDLKIRYMLAQNYAKAGKDRKAIRILESIEREKGVSELIILKKAEIYKKNEKLYNGIREIEKLVKLVPESSQYHVLLAEFYSDFDKQKEALDSYIRAYELDSSNLFAISNLTDYFIRNNQIDKGLFYLEKALHLDEIELSKKIQSVYPFLQDKSILKNNKGRIGKLVNTLIEKYPEEYEVKTLAYDYYNFSGNSKKAYHYIKELIKSKKDKFLLWQQALYHAGQNQDFESMKNIAEEALIFFPNKDELYLYQGLANLQLKQYQSAYQILKNSYDQSTDEAIRTQCLVFLAEAAYNAGYIDEAFSYFEKLIKSNQADDIVKNNYGYYLSLEGKKLRMAEELLRDVVERNPDNATYLDTYAWIWYGMKNYNKALFYAQKAMENDGENGEIIFHYAEILSKLGKKKEALQYYNAAYKRGYSNERIINVIQNEM